MKAYLFLQIVFSILIILFGSSYAIRCLISGQTLCASLFVMLAVAGTFFFLIPSLTEYRNYRTKKQK